MAEFFGPRDMALAAASGMRDAARRILSVSILDRAWMHGILLALCTVIMGLTAWMLARWVTLRNKMRAMTAADRAKIGFSLSEVNSLIGGASAVLAFSIVLMVYFLVQVIIKSGGVKAKLAALNRYARGVATTAGEAARRQVARLTGDAGAAEGARAAAVGAGDGVVQATAPDPTGLPARMPLAPPLGDASLPADWMSSAGRGDWLRPVSRGSNSYSANYLGGTPDAPLYYNCDPAA